MNDLWLDLLILVGAVILGGLVGLERELHGGWAGLRTHTMVSLAAAMFVRVGMDFPNASAADVSRIIQGIAAGIGFLGAGTILKLTDRLEIKGLTTAGSIWLAAAVGTACGAREFGVAAVGVGLTLVILVLFRKLEEHLPTHHGHHGHSKDEKTGTQPKNPERGPAEDPDA